MFKTILKFGLIAAVLVGLYYIIVNFPIESFAIVGILLIVLVFYWIYSLVNTTS